MLLLEHYGSNGDLGRRGHCRSQLLGVRDFYPAVRRGWPPGVLHDVHHLLLHQGSARRRFRWASILAHPVLPRGCLVAVPALIYPANYSRTINRRAAKKQVRRIVGNFTTIPALRKSF